MVCFRQTQSVISPLIDEVQTHIIYQKIPLVHISLVCNILLCVTKIVTKSLVDVLCSVLEGSMSQNFDLGFSFFFMLCRQFVKLFFHYFLRFMTIMKQEHN